MFRRPLLSAASKLLFPRTAKMSVGAAAAMSEAPEALFKLGKLHHVALATHDLQKASDFYRNILGATTSPPKDVPGHGVTIVFIQLDNTKIELLHPLGDKSPIANFLSKHPNGGLHHICIEVDCMHEALRRVRKNGVRTLTEEPSLGADGAPVIFLHPKDCNGILIELEEAKDHHCTY